MLYYTITITIPITITILCYTIVYYAILYYTTLHYTTLHYTALHYTTLHYILIILLIITYNVIGDGDPLPGHQRPRGVAAIDRIYIYIYMYLVRLGNVLVVFLRFPSERQPRSCSSRKP